LFILILTKTQFRLLQKRNFDNCKRVIILIVTKNNSSNRIKIVVSKSDNIRNRKIEL